MKTFSIVYLAVLAAAVAGSPHPHPDAAADAAAVAQPVSGPGSDIFESELVKRGMCYHKSDCGWYNADKCRHYCHGYHRNWSHMEHCGHNGYKWCCCAA